MRPVRLVFAAASCLLAGAAAMPAATIDAMIKDLQKVEQANRQLDLVWWIPPEYFDEAMRADARLTPEARAEFIAMIDDFSLFAIVSVTIGPTGSVRSRPIEDIYEGLTLEIGDEVFLPLADYDIAAGVANVIAIFKPIMAQSLGAVGRSMEMVVFRNRRDDGAKWIAPRESGAFTVKVNGRSFAWRLPLGSMLPPRRDPATGEEFPGNFQFNPFTGARLVDVAADATVENGVDATP